MFAHGFNIHFNQVVPPPDVDVSMIAPKAPGHIMRDLFTQGPGVPALVAVHQDVSGQGAGHRPWPTARASAARGPASSRPRSRKRPRPTSSASRPSLCGGISALIKAAFETLVEAGYQPEVAYFECMHEMKLIVDLFYQGGLAYMRYSVSDTAEYGDYTPRAADHQRADQGRDEEDPAARSSPASSRASGCWRTRPTAPASWPCGEREAEHPIEEVGKRLRSMMSWIKPPRM